MCQTDLEHTDVTWIGDSVLSTIFPDFLPTYFHLFLSLDIHMRNKQLNKNVIWKRKCEDFSAVKQNIFITSNFKIVKLLVESYWMYRFIFWCINLFNFSHEKWHQIFTLYYFLIIINFRYKEIRINFWVKECSLLKYVVFWETNILKLIK